MGPIVIVGAGQAAAQFIESVRKAGYDGDLLLIGEETSLPYQRPPLSKGFLAGKVDEARLLIKPESFYEKNNVTLMLGQRVFSINRTEKTLTFSNDVTCPYDKLIIATGSRVRRLNVSGSELAGVHYVRTVDDAKGVLKDLKTAKNVIVIGGGFIGLETVAALVYLDLNREFTVVERQDRLMERVVSPLLSKNYHDLHEGQGVSFYYSVDAKELGGEENRVEEVILSNGESLKADMVIVGIGILPNIELAEEAGLDVDNGITVDSKGYTSDPNIMAIGECSNHPSRYIPSGRARLESVQNAVDQAKVAALALMGEDVSFDDVPWFWSEQYDTRLQMAGISTGYDDVVLRGDMDSGSFSLIYFKEGNLIAVDSINTVKDHMAARKLIAQGIKIDPQKVADPDVTLKSFLPPKT